MKTVKNLWKNIFNFKGTVSTPEFFKSIFVNIIFMFIAFIPVMLIYAVVLILHKSNGVDISGDGNMNYGIILAGAYYVILTLPFISMLIRRIRDSKISMVIGILVCIAMPFIGFFLVGVMNKRETKHSLVTKVGYTFLVAGFGSNIWLILIAMIIRQLNLYADYGIYSLMLVMLGIFIAYIGTKIDERRNEE